MAGGAQTAGTVVGASTTAAVTTMAAVAGGVQAVPIAGQVSGAALALSAVLLKVFGGKRQGKKKAKADAQKAFIKQHRQGMMGGAQQSQARPGGQGAPETQGMGQFQQMQAGEGPIYQSGGGQPQQNTGVNYG